MKSYRLLATFPTLPAAVAQQEVTAQGSSLHVAVGRGLGDIMRRPGVRGRHVERLTIQVICTGKVEKK